MKRFKIMMYIFRIFNYYIMVPTIKLLLIILCLDEPISLMKSFVGATRSSRFLVSTKNKTIFCSSLCIGT